MADGQPEATGKKEAPAFIGQYRVEGVIGRGGMGSVYRATHSTLERPVALKLLPHEFASDPAFVSRFLREARVAATLRHPNIVQVHDAGCSEGRYYIAMELVEGQSLAQRLSSGRRIAEAEGLRLLRQTALGLAAAHEKGLVHRDIKPENLLLDERGELRIADFGLALESAAVTRLTAPGATVGTPLYMSPEQAEGAPADERSDLYSLGATFYHVFAGRPPFEGSNVAGLLYKHQHEAPSDPRKERADVSAGTVKLILRLLAKRPGDRPSSAKELVDWLDRLAEGKSLPSAPERAPKRKTEPRAGTVELQTPGKRSSRLVIGIVAAVVAFLLLAAGAIHARRVDERKVNEALVQARLKLQNDQPEQAVKLLTETSAAVRPDVKGMNDLKKLLSEANEEVRKAGERKRLKDAVARAEQLRKNGKPKEAVTVLDEALAAVPADTDGRAEAETALAKARDEVDVQDLKERQRAFTTKLFSEQWKDCKEFVLPGDRMKHGAAGVEIRLGLLRGVAMLFKISEDKVRIERVQLTPDRQAADVYISLKLADGWKTQKPTKWHRKKDGWYLHFE